MSPLHEEIIKDFEEILEQNKRTDSEDVWTDYEKIEYLRKALVRVHDAARQEAMDGWVEKLEQPKTFPERESDEYDAGYNRALSDLLAYAKEQMAEIKGCTT